MIWFDKKKDKERGVIETLDKFEGPLMPPRRKFRVRLNIREIKRGKPSICDDIEI